MTQQFEDDIGRQWKELALAEGHRKAFPNLRKFQQKSVYVSDIERCAREGMTLNQAAKDIGISRSRVSQLASDFGIKLRRAYPVKQ